jgi:hypothetical protein
MAKTKLVFQGADGSFTHMKELTTYLVHPEFKEQLNIGSELLAVELKDVLTDEFQFIHLDKSTAIKLVKTLKFHISRMEVDNE